MSDLIGNDAARATVRSDGIGPIRVLAIGVSRQAASSNFPELPQAENNAVAVRDCFLDYPQLFADPNHVTALTTKGGGVSRGAILGAVREITSKADTGQRILVFFSGHGHQIDNQLYLAPDDAYDAEDPTCMVGVAQFLQLLGRSQASQKTLILDCCWPADISQKLLKDSLCQSKDVAVLSSTADDAAFTTMPSDSRYSLLTYHLKAALGGAKEALEGNLLTLRGLFRYVSEREDSVVESQPSGVIPFGDFTPKVNSSQLALDRSPVQSVNFSDSQTMLVKEVLTGIKKFAYSAEYLQDKVNDKLAQRFEEDLGKIAASLSNNFNFPEDDVSVEGASIRFPGGRYWLQYEAEDSKSGQLIRSATFSETWFDTPGEMADVLKTLELHPTHLQFGLRKAINLKSMVPGMKAAGWTLTSRLENKAEFTQGMFRLAIESDTITFHGFLASELFGDVDTKQSKLAGNVLRLVGQGKGSA